MEPHLYPKVFIIYFLADSDHKSFRFYYKSFKAYPSLDTTFPFSKKKSGFQRRPQNLRQSPKGLTVYLINIKSNGRLFRIFVAFSECPNFNPVYPNGKHDNFLYVVQWNLDLRKPDLRKNIDLRKIVGTTNFLVHKLFDLRKIF